MNKKSLKMLHKIVSFEVRSILFFSAKIIIAKRNKPVDKLKDDRHRIMNRRWRQRSSLVDGLNGWCDSANNIKLMYNLLDSSLIACRSYNLLLYFIVRNSKLTKSFKLVSKFV